MTDELPTSYHYIRLSIIPLGLSVGAIMFFIDSVYAALLFFFSETNLSGDIAVLWIVHTVKALLLIYLVLQRVLTWATTIYYLDSHHLTHYSGIFKTDENVYELRSLRSVNRHQGWLGRMLNFGDLEMVFGASGYREEVWLRGIHDPHKYERVFSSFLGAESREFISFPSNLQNAKE